MEEKKTKCYFCNEKEGKNEVKVKVCDDCLDDGEGKGGLGKPQTVTT